MEKEVEVEELEGCMCEYIPDDLRTQLEALAEKLELYPSEVVNGALRVGLAIILGKCTELWPPTVKSGQGKIKQKKIRGKLSGAGL